jgi:tRNA uridine 5-carboxymethylaminomethyl modification enzyme
MMEERDGFVETKRLEKIFHQGNSLAQLLRRPESSYEDLPQMKSDLDPEVKKQVEIEIKYAGYIVRERERIKTSREQEERLIPADFDYDLIHSLRYEAREKMKKIRPENLGQASRISGVNPSDITLLGMWLSKKQNS